MSVEVTQILTRISQADPPSTSDAVVGAGDTIVFTLVTDAPVYVSGYGVKFPTLTLSNGAVATYAGLDSQGRLEFSYRVAANSDVSDLGVTGFGPDNRSILPKDIYFDELQVIDREVGNFEDIIVNDLNRDGKSDIIVIDQSGFVKVYYSSGAKEFSKKLVSFSNLGRLYSYDLDLNVADVNGDGVSDFLVSHRESKVLAISLGLGDGNFAEANIVYGPQQGADPKFYPYSSAASDLNGDGNIDIIVNYANKLFGQLTNSEWPDSSGGDPTIGVIKVFYGDGKGAFSLSKNSISTKNESFLSVDINNDGIADLLSNNSSVTEIRLGSKDNSLELVGVVEKPRLLKDMFACDLNADGKTDLLMTGIWERHSLARDLKILFGNGDGTFEMAPQSALEALNKARAEIKGVFDVDGDGIEDLVGEASYYYYDSGFRSYQMVSSIDVLRGRGDGAFEDARTFPAEFYVARSAFGDLDGNGKIDAVSTGLSRNLSYLSNKSLDVPRSFDASSLVMATGAQTGIRIDTMAPLVAGVTAGGLNLVDGTGTLTTGQTATITLTLSEAVTVTNAGSLMLSLNDGGQATFDAAVSTATQLVFRHVVGLEQIASDLAVTGVALNGAVIRDAAGNEAVLSNAATNPAGILRIDGDTGSAGDDAFKGRGGAQTFRGLAGDDTYQVNTSQDVVLEAVGEGRDTVTTHVTYALQAGEEIEVLRAQSSTGLNPIDLTGNAFAQTLIGNDGANTLDGGGGADVMTGEGGNDTYLIDDAGDQVVEAAGGGNDRVFAATSYRLAAGQEIEALQLLASTGKARLDLAGNEYGQRLVGNAGANLLDGGGGADTMIGGRGDDTYLVDAAGDQVVEAAGGGNDRVFATASYQLTAGQEVEALQLLASTGKAKLDLIGNEFGQTLVGNAGANVLDGRGGADTMIGGRGDDKYVVDNAGDIVREAKGGGFDTVLTSVSHRLAAGVEVEAVRLLLSTGQLNLNLTGNEFGQALGGNAGANVLDGRGGSDILTGGRGQDAFQFSTRPGAGNVDRITDFAPVDDTIRLFEDVFSALDAGPLAARAFKNISTGKVDADDRILYEQATGALFYDADGSGRALAVKFAVLDNHAKLTHADFFVI